MVDGVLAQSETDAERFRALGAKGVETVGNVKFDQALDGLDDATDWRKELGLDERPVVVVGSLRAEEFDGFADCVACAGEVQWVVAPRHVERTEEFLGWVASTRAEADDCPLEIGHRSQRTSGDLTILDTYGELSRVYAVADVAVVGGSFKKVGMQNPIQPLAHGKPVLHGPYTQNFRDVADLAARAGASIVCKDVSEFRLALDGLLDDPARRALMGQAARRLVEENRGASARMAQIVASKLADEKREQAPALPK